MNAAFAALGRAVVRFRWLILAIWIVGTVLAVQSLPSLGSQVNNDNSSFLPNSAPSVEAATLAEPLVGSSSLSQVPVVAVATAGSLTPADQAAVTQASRRLEAVDTVRKVTFLGQSASGRAVRLLVVSSVSPFDQTGTETLVDHLGAALSRTTTPSDLQLHLAGQVATSVANQKQSEQTGNLIQLLSILFIIVLLGAIFRSVLAPLATLLPAVLALELSSSLIGGLGASGLKISSITQVLLIVLILGAGTDYGLFLVFRVREELWRGRDLHTAVAHGVSRVGESITASAGTVIVALLSLLFATFGVYHDLGVPLAIGIAVMLLAGLTLLPALLCIFGRALFWPSDIAPREHREGLWGRVAGRLVRRPALTLCAGVLVFGALAAAVAEFQAGGFGGAISAPAGSSVAKGNALMAQQFPESSSNPTNLVMRFDRPVWAHPATLEQATAGLNASHRFTRLAGPLDPNGTRIEPAVLARLHAELGPAARLGTAPPAGTTVSPELYNAYRATARYVSPDGRTVQWEAGLAAGDPASTNALHAVPAIRDTVTAVAARTGASASGVAGEAPALYDVSSISDRDLLRIVPIAVLAIGIVLALVLRSLVAPLYLIVSVALSYLASLGLSVIVFIGLAGQGGITFVLPFLMFIFLLALGEDYNILVMTRIREEAHHRSLRDAVVRAVGATGPTITSAGLVLAGTFAVLAVAGGSGPAGDEIRAIGFGLAVGILLDTFVVRTLLVPATVSLLGRFNWWPSAMGRRRHGSVPEAGAEPVGAAASPAAGHAPGEVRS